MKNLRTLAWLAVGAIIVAAFYAGAVRDRGVEIDFEAEDRNAGAYVREGDRGEFRFKSEDIALEAHWRGDFKLNAAGDDIESLDGKLSIDLEEDGETRRAIFEPRRDGVRKRYIEDGKEEQDAAAVEDGARDVFVRFLRVSGIEARQRMTALLRDGDAAPALEEIAALESDIAARRYILVLNERRDLSADELAMLGDILKRMEGDQNLRLTLSGLLHNDALEAESVPLLLKAARRMESDHDIRKLLESAAKAPLGDAALAQVLQLYARIEGDHDLRKAAEALLDNDGLTAAQKSLVLLAAAQRMEGDRDIRALLEDVAGEISGAQELAAAWFAGFNALEGSRDQRLSIESAARDDLEPQLMYMLIESTGAIEDSREQRQALEALAAAFDNDYDAPGLIAAYRDAAGLIEDDRERARALAALRERASDPAN